MTRGRKKGQTKDTPAETTAFQMRELDPDFWRRVKILALSRKTNIKELIVNLLAGEIKKDKIL
ncbi:hypothetical protein KAR91_52865 [Candidatus Pacearchaeota archaeon]|nr:hypothetical protein [Candidatus Pacearchaeota archaeon]